MRVPTNSEIRELGKLPLSSIHFNETLDRKIHEAILDLSKIGKHMHLAKVGSADQKDSNEVMGALSLFYLDGWKEVIADEINFTEIANRKSFSRIWLHSRDVHANLAPLPVNKTLLRLRAEFNRTRRG